MIQKQTAGHLMALLCVPVWGSSFVVSKGLLAHLHPVQLMLLRFILAYAALWIACPKWYFRWREEGRFLVMGLLANTLYCWAENTAITLTLTSNVSILVSTAPIITALMLSLVRKEERINRSQAICSGISFAGVVLVVFNGVISLQVHPAGDLLALLAAALWALYGILLRRWFAPYVSVLVTRKLMFYGILTTLPLVMIQGDPINFSALFTLVNSAKLAYLGLIGSALCYLLWSVAVQRLGVLKANLYIYMVPLVTLLVSAAVLQETITVMGIAGILLIIAGMVLGAIQTKEL